MGTDEAIAAIPAGWRVWHIRNEGEFWYCSLTPVGQSGPVVAGTPSPELAEVIADAAEQARVRSAS